MWILFLINNEIIMRAKEVKELLEFHETIYSNLTQYIESYVEWVKKNIPYDFWESFGVEYYFDNYTVGTLIGFVDQYGKKHPLNWDKSYYAQGNFNYPVEAVSKKVVREFASYIPMLMGNGIDKIREFNEEATEILKGKEDI